ncbi:hypothetical protein [Photobacterium sp. DNB22_13_2]
MIDFTNDDIQHYAKGVFLSQTIVGLGTVFLSLVIGSDIHIKSVLLGVILTILPTQLGMQMASYRAKQLGDFAPSSLARTNIITKWVYTACLLASIIHFSSVDLTELFVAYIVTTFVPIIAARLTL